MSTPTPTASWRARRSTTGPTVTPTALWKAAKQHDSAKVKELIQEFSNAMGSLSIVNEFHPLKSTNALMIACKKRDKSHKHRERSAADTVQVLLEFGADMDVASADKDGNTALHFAAMSNQARSVEFLLHAGANAFALNRHGYSPLDIARWRDSRDVADVLTQNARIHSGWLHFKQLAEPLAAIQIRMWKKRYVEVLACDNTRSTIELSLFKDRDDVRPSRVIILRGGTHEFVPKDKTNWHERHNMFHANRQLVVLKMSATTHQFSRHERWILSQEEAGRTERLRFATDLSDQRDEWLSVLNNSFGVVRPPVAGYMGPTLRSAVPAPVEVDFTAHESVLWSSSDAPSASAPSFSSTTPVDLPEPSALQAAGEGEDQGEGKEYVDDGSGRGECLICMDAKRNAICVPCGHVAGCHLCLVRHVATVHKCPICRAPVQTVIKIYDC